MAYSLFMWATEEVEEQFFGSVTNVRVFSSAFNSFANIEDLSLHPCEHQGDLLAWEAGLWEVKGDNWILIEESQKSVCRQEETYLLAVPFEIEAREAIKLCQKRLGGGILSSYDNASTLRDFAEWFESISAGSCSFLWTPYSDEKSEGDFVNMNDNAEATYLPWGPSQPNGGREENFVRMTYNPDDIQYIDSANFVKGTCSSCQLNTTLLLRLAGLCNDSFIGCPSFIRES